MWGTISYASRSEFDRGDNHAAWNSFFRFSTSYSGVIRDCRRAQVNVTAALPDICKESGGISELGKDKQGSMHVARQSFSKSPSDSQGP